MDQPRSGSRALAEAEVLRSLRRVCPDPLVELAQIARTLTADRPVNAQLDSWAERWRLVDVQLDGWAEKWRLKQLREDAKFHVLYWAAALRPQRTSSHCIRHHRPCPWFSSVDVDLSSGIAGRVVAKWSGPNR